MSLDSNNEWVTLKNTYLNIIKIFNILFLKMNIIKMWNFRAFVVTSTQNHRIIYSYLIKHPVPGVRDPWWCQYIMSGWHFEIIFFLDFLQYVNDTAPCKFSFMDVKAVLTNCWFGASENFIPCVTDNYFWDFFLFCQHKQNG